MVGYTLLPKKRTKTTGFRKKLKPMKKDTQKAHEGGIRIESLKNIGVNAVQ